MNRARIKHRANAQMREVYGRQWRHVKKFVKKFFDEKNVGDKALFSAKEIHVAVRKESYYTVSLCRVHLNQVIDKKKINNYDKLKESQNGKDPF